MFKVERDGKNEERIVKMCDSVLIAIQQEIPFLKDLELLFTLTYYNEGKKEFIKLESQTLSSNLFGIFAPGIVKGLLVVESEINSGELEPYFTCRLKYMERSGNWDDLRLSNQSQTEFGILYNVQNGQTSVTSSNNLVITALRTIETPFRFGENSETNLTNVKLVREYFKEPRQSSSDKKEITLLLDKVIKHTVALLNEEYIQSYYSHYKYDIDEALFNLQFFKQELDTFLLVNK